MFMFVHIHHTLIHSSLGKEALAQLHHQHLLLLSQKV